MRPARKIWAGILVVLLLTLACSPPATPVVVPTVTSIPTNTRAPTPTIPPSPAIPPTAADPRVQPSRPAPTTSAGTVVTVPVITVPVITVPVITVPVITVGEATFAVELADTPEKRSRGLSGRPVLDAGTGMLFVFDTESRSAFWMREMQFPLDFVWIGADCSVADISEDVPEPPPAMDLSDLPRYQPSVPVQYVLEINSGEIAAAGITRGDPVGFGGSLTGRYGC